MSMNLGVFLLLFVNVGYLTSIIEGEKGLKAPKLVKQDVIVVEKWRTLTELAGDSQSSKGLLPRSSRTRQNISFR